MRNESRPKPACGHEPDDLRDACTCLSGRRRAVLQHKPRVAAFLADAAGKLFRRTIAAREGGAP